jgi:hypothetical protein
MVGVLTQALGPDVLSTILASLPAVMTGGTSGGQAGVINVLTSVLIERADSLKSALLRALQNVALMEVLKGVDVEQGEGMAVLRVSLAETLGDDAIPAASIMDIYTIAIAVGMENLFPLPPGVVRSVQSDKPSKDKAQAPTQTPQTMKTRAGQSAMVLHFTAWWRTRGR